jgi:energy-coupling factor transporter transmembrane protein EcfT
VTATVAAGGRRSSFGPLSLLLACVAPVAGAFAIDDGAVGLWCLAAQCVLLGWLVDDLGASARRFALGGLAALSIAITTWLYGGHDLGAATAAAARILYIVVPSALVGPRIRPSELGDHLAQRLHLPPRVVVAAVVALQRIDTLGEQWRHVQRARRARGLGLDGGVVRRLRGSAGSALAMLVTTMRQTGTLALAMDARGFARATTRTWAAPAPWQLADSGIALVAVGLAVLPWILSAL